ncbi:MAG: patatin-like phospholipase family protein [Ginsengibacter sp.]
MTNSSHGFDLRILRFISQLLKSLWLFFPGILFLLLFIFCFWMLGQGKDIIIAFTENESQIGFLSFNYTRTIFFLAIGFWIYVSWYSSRIISYIKKTKQEDKVRELASVGREEAEVAFKAHKNYFEINENFLDEFPRMIGNACFLILELAVLQSPLLYNPLGSTMAIIIFIIALILLRYLNSWITKSQSIKPSFRKAFRVLLIIFIALMLFVSFLPGKAHIFILLCLLILFHAIFIFYINLRRVMMEDEANTVKAKLKGKQQKGKRRSFFIKVMDFFCVPRKESGYFKWFLFIGISGIIFYLLSINWLSFARGIGPFPFIILAFGVLLAFGNTVTAFSVRNNVNFHFLLFVLALVFGLKETHYVRKFHPAGGDNNYANRPQLQTYLTAWLNGRNVLADSSSGGYDIYFVMANGGASRSGYWTAAVLGKIEDSTLQYDPQNRFSDHVFCLSGTSGGGVGVASFFALLKNKSQKVKPLYSLSSKEFLKQDYFTYTVARMLGPDFFNYIFHVSSVADRAAALESSFEESSLKSNDSTYRVPFYDSLSQFPALKNGKIYLPLLCINTTRMQDGNPGVVTNLKLDSAIFNNRVDVLKLLKKDEDITLASGAILGARFPYLSPAGRIANNYFVDGGYFDNSGAGVVQEMIRGILNIAEEDSLHNGTLYKQIQRLHFKVLHITNSPVNLDSSDIKKVAPFKNDVIAPILTIVGAYDMQTTVNDSRLINFIKDINNYSANKADYLQVPLYEDSMEWKKDPLRERFKDKEPSYAMNWFMSDTTIRRIDKRLQGNGKLDSLIKSMRSQKDSAR